MFVKNIPIFQSKKIVSGSYTQIEGEFYYKINHYDQMPPFLMSIVSSSDHWMYISSKGSLSAGRINREQAIFPYITDDKIHDQYKNTGSKSIFLVKEGSKTMLWEAFSDKYEGIYEIERNLYKNFAGNKLIFEEINHDFGLQFRYCWKNSESFGFVRQSDIQNIGTSNLEINLIDGVQNILPYGINSQMQTNLSNLVDAYKKNELLPYSGIGIYYLSSIPTDKAEPSEGLKATLAWSVGAPKSKKLLSSEQLNTFTHQKKVEQETDIRAKRGAYFIQSEFILKPKEKGRWYIITDTNKDFSDIAKIEYLIETKKDLANLIEADIKKGTTNLQKIVSGADGLQKTGDIHKNARHFANVLFNCMRGGIFDTENLVDILKYSSHLSNSNKMLLQSNKEFMVSLSQKMTLKQLLDLAKESKNSSLIRLTYEYLPLYFSRRHGDPSRPWNIFNIKLKNPDGSRKYYYEGNWRDIFQNWEALAWSFPNFIEGMITKFVNASTIDGYNPYRISSNGIDWEVIEPENPWSNIGYWGDHQIIYLSKLLELSVKFHSKELNKLLSSNYYCYANVPYRIKNYSEILNDSQNTIVFDAALDKKLGEDVIKLGSDAKLIRSENNAVYHVNLTEKLLLTALTKLSNYVPEAGIWLNTQRPEWNDANNALVGNGVSLVTLYYLRRYMVFLSKLFAKNNENTYFDISLDVFNLFRAISDIFQANTSRLDAGFDNSLRYKMTTQLGEAGSQYREKVYTRFSENKKELSTEEISSFLAVAINHLEHTIAANSRKDGLYHTYNIISFNHSEKTLSVSNLPEMLEGQVAVLSSGLLNTEESISVLHALKNSKLYRADQNSYILYPNKTLKRFTEKNTISEDLINKSALLKQLIANKNSDLVLMDVKNMIHFNGDFRNSADLLLSLDKLPDVYSNLVKNEKDLILAIWEDVFNHSSFTGRSGTFFKYEGLGSIYWHMVSKLLLSVSEIWQKALNTEKNETILNKIQEIYRDIQNGIGAKKTPLLYGAFPTDPYSHTPEHSGAQQPGMTGQVKEDIISRFSELGLQIEDGCISFSNTLIEKTEYLGEEAVFEYYDIQNEFKQMIVAKDSLAFTYCQVPIVYHLSVENKIELSFKTKSKLSLNNLTINSKLSKLIFERTGEIQKIEVFFSKK